jgi:hypothetical protein
VNKRNIYGETPIMKAIKMDNKYPLFIACMVLNFKSSHRKLAGKGQESDVIFEENINGRVLGSSISNEVKLKLSRRLTKKKNAGMFSRTSN